MDRVMDRTIVQACWPDALAPVSIESLTESESLFVVSCRVVSCLGSSLAVFSLHSFSSLFFRFSFLHLNSSPTILHSHSLTTRHVRVAMQISSIL